jgi:hypothetical protein
MTGRHRAVEFRRFLDRVDCRSDGLDLQVICDNSSIHSPPRSSGGCLGIRACAYNYPDLQLLTGPGRAPVRRADIKQLRRGHPTARCHMR